MDGSCWWNNSLTYALDVHGRQTLSLQFLHSYTKEWGPEWQTWQFHWINVVSDLMTLKSCWQFAGAAIVMENAEEIRGGYGVVWSGLGW